MERAELKVQRILRLCPVNEEHALGGEIRMRSGVVPNCDPCQIITPLVLVGLGLGVGEGLGLGVGLGLGNHIAISMRGVIIWQGVENGHNTGNALQVASATETRVRPSQADKPFARTMNRNSNAPFNDQATLCSPY